MGEYPTTTLTLPLSLDAKATDTFKLILTVPPTALRGTSDYATVTATSRTAPEVRHAVSDTTIVRHFRYIYLPIATRNYPPPWTRADGTQGISVYNVSVCPSDHLLQYAGTGAEGLYRSADGGRTWEYWALSERTNPVVAKPDDCDDAFATVWGGGVYRVIGKQDTVARNDGLGELKLYGLVASADSQWLYAGTNSMGVYKTQISPIAWNPINNNIPAGDGQRIRSLYIISDTLYAGGRQCTYYHSTDWGSSWQVETVLDGGKDGPCEDAQVWAIAQMGDVLFASLGNKGLYRRAAGTGWAPVTTIPSASIYRFGLLPHQSRLYVGTYGYGIYTCNTDGACKPLSNPGLGTPFIRGLAMAEVNGRPRLLAGSDDGVWWLPLPSP
jgi:hypothetical protein